MHRKGIFVFSAASSQTQSSSLPLLGGGHLDWLLDDNHGHICFCFWLDAILKFSKTHRREGVTAGIQSLGNRKEKKETKITKKLVAKLLSMLADHPAWFDNGIFNLYREMHLSYFSRHYRCSCPHQDKLLQTKCTGKGQVITMFITRVHRRRHESSWVEVQSTLGWKGSSHVI